MQNTQNQRWLKDNKNQDVGEEEVWLWVGDLNTGRVFLCSRILDLPVSNTAAGIGLSEKAAMTNQKGGNSTTTFSRDLIGGQEEQ